MEESNHNLADGHKGRTMQAQILIGESNLHDFTSWWESHLPSWLILYCIKGSAQLSFGTKPYAFGKGMATIMPPDSYPAVNSASDDFLVFYILIGRDFANRSLFDIPRNFYDAIYVQPILRNADFAAKWKTMFEGISNDSSNSYSKPILSALFNAFVLDFYDKWQRQYRKFKDGTKRSPAEQICIKFYDLVFDHYREERSIAYYASQLCITPSYLAVVMKEFGGESPKEAIYRQVTMDMIYMLRNTNKSNKEIAQYLHFPDTSYMCRYFRRQTGFSPAEYRNMQITEKLGR